MGFKKAVSDSELFNENIIKTGYVDLDYWTNGLRRGETYLLAGIPHLVRIFALNIIANIGSIEHKEIAYFLMGEKQNETLSWVMRIIKKMNFTEDAKAENFEELFGETTVKISGSDVYIKVARGLEIDSIAEMSRQSQKKPDLVIVDGVYSTMMLNEVNSVDECVFFKDMRKLAQELNCVVLILGYAETKTVLQNKITKSETVYIRDSENRQLANNVLLLNEADNSDSKNEKLRLMEITIEKSSDRHNCTIRLAYLPEYLKFSTVDSNYGKF